MNWREDLLDEMGYIICPISFPEYQYCDENCEECETHKEFVEFWKERSENKQ